MKTQGFCLSLAEMLGKKALAQIHAHRQGNVSFSCLVVLIDFLF